MVDIINEKDTEINFLSLKNGLKSKQNNLDNHIKQENSNQQNQKKIKKEWIIYFMTINACLGTTFYGFNMGVYNSAQRIMQKLNGWSEDQYIQYTSIITALLPLGALIGCLQSKYIINCLNGIRKTMIVFDIIGILGTIIIISDTSIINLTIGRFLCGIVIGINTAIVPVYIKDFSPIEISGRLGAMNQLFLTFGSFCSYMSSLLVPLPSEIQKLEYNNQINWRILLGLPIILCIIRLFLLLFVFKLETPQFMIRKGKQIEIKNFLQQIYNEKQCQQIIQEIELNVTIQKQKLQNFNQKSIKVNNSQTKSFQQKCKSEEEYYKKKLFELGNKCCYKKTFFIGVLIQSCTQLCGVGAITFYSIEIFKDVTGDEKTAQISTIFLGLSNTIATILGIKILQIIGRRSQMLIGLSIIQITMYILAILQNFYNDITKIISIVLVFIFLQGWQISLGAVTWVYNAEILDSNGISFSTFVRWNFTMLMGFIFPYMKLYIKLFGCFIFFGGFGTICFVFLKFMMKETAGKTLCQIIQSFCSEKSWNEYENQAKEYAKQMVSQQDQELQQVNNVI